MVLIEKDSDLSFISISNNKGLKITLSSLGASIFAIYFNNELMTLTLKNKSDYRNPELYHGKTIGPVCGRIKDGRIDNFQYDLNEENVTRHGGNNGLSSQTFDYKVDENKDTVSVIFSLNDFIVEYVIAVNEDSFKINYSYDGKPQPIALTNHSFFHLGDAFNKLSLKVGADYFVENDPLSLVPLQSKAIISCLDFKEGKSIFKNIDDSYLKDSRTKGYDHYLHFTNYRTADLFNDKYNLHIETDFSGLLIYSDNYAFNEETIDQRVGIRKALAIEPQDSPLERKIYCNSNRYQRFIKYIFSIL